MRSLVWNAASIALVAAQPDLSLLQGAWTPVDQPVYGAPSVTNAWGSLLASTASVSGFNALLVAPFSQGWDPENLYGWPVDAASLYIDGVLVPPAAFSWLPFSVLRNGTAQTAAGSVQLAVTSEIRQVFESQAVLLETNISVPATASGTTFTVTLDMALTLRYYPRADQCSSWHYPTHSEPCCWNWFPPEPAHGSEGQFLPSWAGCGGSGSPYGSLSISDTSSPAGSGWSFPQACSSAAAASSSLIELAAPTSVNGTRGMWRVSVPAAGGVVRVRTAMVFSNASDPAVNVAAARSLADAFPTAWADARGDWQARFNAVFDPLHSHFSGHLPLLSTTASNSTTASTAADFSFGFEDLSSPMEYIYYQSMASFLANERTNLPLQQNLQVPCTQQPDDTRSRLLQQDSLLTHPVLEDCPTCWHVLTPYAATGSSGSSGLRNPLNRYLQPVTVRLRAASDATVLALPRITGSDYSVTGQPVFISGAAMNTSTNTFFWDMAFAPFVYAILEPTFLTSQLPLWLGSTENGVPATQAFWGYDYASSQGVGNYYSANDASLFTLLLSYLQASGDWGFLQQEVPITGSNSSANSSSTPVMGDFVTSLALHWQDPFFNTSGYLADMGPASALLECVPTYIHRVPSFNAANAWMMWNAADVLQWQGNATGAATLRQLANAVAGAVQQQLYVNGSGYWLALYPNGSSTEVKHVIDYTYVTLALGVDRTPGGSGRPGAWISASQAAEMTRFVQNELIVPHWMRALSLNDSAAPYSNRSDHGPSGAYIGWPALTLRSLGMQGAYDAALAFLTDTLYVAQLGPYGQATEIRPPGLPYKPMVFTLYNAVVSASFANTVLQTFFGFSPPLVFPDQPLPNPLMDASTPRGFTGVMHSLAWQGQLWDIVSNSTGLYFLPSLSESAET